MKEQSQRMAACGMAAALCTALMALGAATGLGTYLAPMLAGLCLAVIGERWGVRYQLTLWAAVSALCFLLAADVEQNLLFFGLLGWYPALAPRLERLPPALGWAAKLLLFNAAAAALEALTVLALAPESVETGLALALLALGNVTFVLYDIALRRFRVLFRSWPRRR